MSATPSPHPAGLLLFDGSVVSCDAAEVAGALLPDLAWDVVSAWIPGFGDGALRHRVAALHGVAAVENARHEAESDAQSLRVARRGAALVAAAGASASPRALRSGGSLELDVGRLVEERGARLVAVGARGLGGAAALGSTTDAIVRCSHVPTLVVHHPLLADEWARLPEAPLAVADDGTASGAAAVEAAIALAGGRALVVIHVGDAAVAEAGAARARAAGLAASTCVAVPAGRIGATRGRWGAIVEAAAEVSAAAIVVGRTSRGTLRELALGSTTLGVLRHAGLPVIVVPRP